MDKISIKDSFSTLNPVPIVLIIDTTYFRTFALMIFRSAYHKKNIYWKFVNYETIIEYIDGVNYLKQKGWTIVAIVCDGRKGLFKAFYYLPVQMCHYHQSAIIKRKLTSNPKLEAAKELKQISNKLSIICKHEFIELLNIWYNKWKIFINEKTFNNLNNKYFYTHKNLRSSYFSLKHHLPYLFIFQDYPDLFIPNTTNSADGYFNYLKKMIGLHQGLKDFRKMKFIEYYLK